MYVENDFLNGQKEYASAFLEPVYDDILAFMNQGIVVNHCRRRLAWASTSISLTQGNMSEDNIMVELPFDLVKPSLLTVDEIGDLSWEMRDNADQGYFGSIEDYRVVGTLKAEINRIVRDNVNAILRNKYPKVGSYILYVNTVVRNDTNLKNVLIDVNISIEFASK